MSDWFKVDNLEEQQIEDMKKYEAGVRDVGGDFQSYRMLVEGNIEGSGIVHHNVLHDGGMNLAKTISQLIGQYAREHKFRYTPTNMTVGDFGGGVGFLDNGLSLIYKKVVSYDVAEYAGIYGKSHFPQVNFVTRGLKEDTNLEEGPFDMVLAYEFYPFTRTDNWEYNKAYIEMCFDNMNSNSYLAIGLPNGPTRENLLRNKKAMEKEYSDRDLEIMTLPFSKIKKLIKSVKGSQILSDMAGLAKEKHVLVVMHKD